LGGRKERKKKRKRQKLLSIWKSLLYVNLPGGCELRRTESIWLGSVVKHNPKHPRRCGNDTFQFVLNGIAWM
jgi:hypothetical protein